MYLIITQVLNLEDAAPPPPTSLNSDLLKTFAFEAEQCGDYDLAHQYYKEVCVHVFVRVCMGRVWLGITCIRIIFHIYTS